MIIIIIIITITATTTTTTLFWCQVYLAAGQRPTNWGHHLYHGDLPLACQPAVLASDEENGEREVT